MLGNFPLRYPDNRSSPVRRIVPELGSLASMNGMIGVLLTCNRGSLRAHGLLRISRRLQGYYFS